MAKALVRYKVTDRRIAKSLFMSVKYRALKRSKLLLFVPN